MAAIILPFKMLKKFPYFGFRQKSVGCVVSDGWTNPVESGATHFYNFNSCFASDQTMASEMIPPMTIPINAVEIAPPGR